MIGYGRELPDDEAIGIACGWWPSFAIAVRRLREAQRRRVGDDHHRRPGVRHRRGDGAAAAGRRGAGHAARRTSRSSTRTPTPAPSTAGASGSQTTFNNGRAVVEAAERRPRAAADARGGRARGVARPTSSWPTARCASRARPTKSVAITDLARDGPGRRAPARPRLGHAAAGARGRRVRLRRPAGHGVVGRAHVHHATRRACKVDRETGVVRVLEVAAAHDSGTILNPIGAEGQVEGGVVMGIGMALLGGHAARRRRPPAEPAPARLQAPDRRRRAADQRRTGCEIATPRRRGRAAPRASAEPPCVPTAGRDRQRDRQGDRRGACTGCR